MNKKWLKFGITNFVTLLRVIGIFALLPIFKIYGGFATFLLSTGCFATDFIDGLFDALSDKFFLVVNMILLASITPIAIIPIILELSIAGVSALKYNEGLNVQSNIFGKLKMWVAGITISLSYLLVDKTFLNYLGADLANKISNINENHLFGTLVLSEIITLTSYIYSYNKEKEEASKEIPKETHEDEKIEEEINNASFKEILFEHDYYEKYKDYGNLKLVRSLSKKNKRR